MYALIRPLLFRLDPERSHDVIMAVLSALSGSNLAMRVMRARPPRAIDRGVSIMGLNVANGVGLAAGLDKDALAFPALAALGFGWVELGTVTPRPQPGNPRPRLFRLTRERALINRMGFNSCGLDRFLANLAARRANCDCVVGINIGKNADTPMANANRDYLHALEKVYPHGDYVTVNISSPNTESLRELQRIGQLQSLLDALLEQRDRLTERYGRRVPIAIKLSPDLADTDIDATGRLLRDRGIDGVIATNTTTQRPGTLASPCASQQGGLSGRPLEALATQMVASLKRTLGDQVPIIGTGGVEDAAGAARKRAAGAVAVQCYTSFIYRGPRLLGRLHTGALNR